MICRILDHVAHLIEIVSKILLIDKTFLIKIHHAEFSHKLIVNIFVKAVFLAVEHFHYVAIVEHPAHSDLAVA